MEMKIHKGNGIEISSYKDWEEAYKKGKDGHSALEFGKFIMNKNGLEKIQHILELSLKSKITFEKVFIEKGVKFDNFQRESQRDMVINGMIQDKKLFISIEAKASETFGGKINSEYNAALKYKKEHTASKRAERIELIYNNIIPNENRVPISNCDLRYQLFHATASTAYSTKDVGVMMVIELKTNETNKHCLERNMTDFMNFMKSLNAKKLDTEDFLSYDAIIFNKPVRCIYVEIEA